MVDAEGYFHFLGRGDDVISSAGCALVLEKSRTVCSAIRRCRSRRWWASPMASGTRSSRPSWCSSRGQTPSEELAAGIRAGLLKTRLSAHEYPAKLPSLRTLPMTTTGKVMRRVLRERP